MDEFVLALLALRSRAECRSFLDALFTKQELEQMLPVRWGLLGMLINEKMSRRKLSAHARISQVTAARAYDAFEKHEQFLRMLTERIANQRAGHTAAAQ